MYQAKDQGRNGHAFYGESMNVRSLDRMELESDLRRAFEANDFTLCYQPKMDLSSGTIVGVEALLRWHHASRGWIPPGSFIALAEETGMIVPLGEWVVHEACKQLKIWAGQGLGYLTIAVNVSPQQFAREDFVDSVLRATRQFGIKPQQLEIEKMCIRDSRSPGRGPRDRFLCISASGRAAARRIPMTISRASISMSRTSRCFISGTASATAASRCRICRCGRAG